MPYTISSSVVDYFTTSIPVMNASYPIVNIILKQHYIIHFLSHNITLKYIIYVCMHIDCVYVTINIT